MTTAVLASQTSTIVPPPGANGPPAFLRGEVLAERFEIRGFLGQGGMGQVFEAFDRELGDVVALKVLRPEIAASPYAIASFKREVSLARRVTHPNVCRIFELLCHPAGTLESWGRKRPMLFLTMELLHGETLAERLQRGVLTIDQALDYADQLAAALDAAHGVGVVHRDLKSANVFLAEDRLVVTDFGLARPTPSRSSSQAPGIESKETNVAGTPGYMAPELLAGQPASPASDVYAFGVVLYEMITGRRPASEAPEPPSRLRPDWPADRDAAILRCLHPRPEKRHRQAGPAALALRAEPKVRNSRWRTVAATCLLVLAALVAGFFDQRSTSSHAATSDDPLIVLADVDNRTGEARFDGALDHAFHVTLTPSPRVRVLSPEAGRQTLQRMQLPTSTTIDRDVGLELSLREGATALIVPHLDRIGSRYLLSVEALDPRTGEQLFVAAAEAADPDAVLTAIDDVTRDLRHGLGESLDSIREASEPLARVTTADLDALRLYSLGADKLDRRLLEQAIPLLQRSLEHDPLFAMAHAKLAAAYRFQGQGHAETAHHLRRAVELEHRLSGFEKHYVRAWAASLEASPDALADWALLSHLYPDQGLAHYNLGMGYVLFEQRWNLATQALAEAARHDSGVFDAVILDRLGSSRLALEEIDAALTSFEKAHRATDHPMPGLGAGLCAAGRYDEGRKALAASRSHPAPRYRLEALLVLAACHADEGHFAEALAVIDAASGLAETEGVGPVVAGAVDLARVALLLRSSDAPTRDGGLKAALSAAMESAGVLLTSDDVPPGSLPVPRLAALGKLSARIGAIEPAQRLFAVLAPIAEDAAFNGYKAAVAMLRGEIELAHGRPTEAARWLDQALALAESVQVHDSLAQIARVLGDDHRATQHRRWITERPGRTYAERAIDESLPLLGVLASS